MPSLKTLPDLWLEGSEHEVVALAPCGCKLIRDHLDSGDPAFYYCSLHNAAPDLLQVCKRLTKVSAKRLKVAQIASIAKLSRRAVSQVGKANRASNR